MVMVMFYITMLFQFSKTLKYSQNVVLLIVEMQMFYQAYWAPSPSKDTWDTIGADE